MLFGEEFEHLHDDGFDGSIDEQRIFHEVFFASDISRRKKFFFSEAALVDNDGIKQKDASLCSNSGRSSLTSQYDNEKEDFSGKPPLRVDLKASYKSNYEVKSSVEDLPDVKPDPVHPSIASTPSENLTSDISQENSGCAYTLAFRVVESYGKAVTSCSYPLKPPARTDKGCGFISRGSFKNGVNCSDQNEKKQATPGEVPSPISQESYATKLLVADPPIFIANNLGTHRKTKPKWKDSCFLKLEEEEFAMPKNGKNDPRPLLRYYINRLLRAAGWVIGRRRRNKNINNGVGEYVYKSPGGRPIREFHRAWSMCGESLLADTVYSVPMGDCMQWADVTELWTDLSRTVKMIEENLNILVTTSSMAHLWCILDPYANAIFIEKTIRLLKEGIAVKAKRSLRIPADAKSAAKCKKISVSARSYRHPIPQLWEHGIYQHGVHLVDDRVGSRVDQILGEPEINFPSQDSSTQSPSIFQVENADEINFIKSSKPPKKSRKLSEMNLTGNDFVDRCSCPTIEVSSSRSKSKKSKACHLDDGDLLISTIMITKSCTDAKKWTAPKSKPLRKRKTPKGSCRLLPRSIKKGGKHIMEGKWSAVGSRTVLSWLIHRGVIFLNDVIQYRDLKDDAVLKDGLITTEGILCNCCHKVLSISEFKFHAGFQTNRPCTNLFMESSKPFTICQLEAWSAEYKARKVAPQMNSVFEMDQNDDSCGRCGDVGELICCDNCPSAFHQGCLFEQELPDGNWYCPQCRCQICGDVVIDNEASRLLDGLKCPQCEDKYHGTCLQRKGLKIGMGSETWFCGDSCHQVYTGLQSRIGLNNLLTDGFSWTLLRCIPFDHKVHSRLQLVALKAECNSKLAVAITIMEECFLPMVDTRTGIDMIPQVIFNWGSEFARLDYSGFYTVLLEEDDAVMSVASIRIHGTRIAELPLIATCSKNRRRGMCRRLINAIEKMLISLNVKKLVVSAIPDLVETWTVGFGFKPIEEDERRSLSEISLMVFPCSVWLMKKLYEEQNIDQRNGSYDMILDSTGAGAYKTDPHDAHLSVRQSNVETQTSGCFPESLQDCQEVSGILQTQQPELLLDEHDPNSRVQEMNVMARHVQPEPQTMSRNMEEASGIAANEPSDLASQVDEVKEDATETRHSDSGDLQSSENSVPPFHLVSYHIRNIN